VMAKERKSINVIYCYHQRFSSCRPRHSSNSHSFLPIIHKLRSFNHSNNHKSSQRPSRGREMTAQGGGRLIFMCAGLAQAGPPESRQCEHSRRSKTLDRKQPEMRINAAKLFVSFSAPRCRFAYSDQSFRAPVEGGQQWNYGH
jgi:hypothetical protein